MSKAARDCSRGWAPFSTRVPFGLLGFKRRAPPDLRAWPRLHIGIKEQTLGNTGQFARRLSQVDAVILDELGYMPYLE